MRMNNESREQQLFIQWCSLNTKKYAGLDMIFAIPNGGKRNKLEAVKLKREGVKAGVPDLFLPVPKGKYHGLFIEMKFGKNTTTEKQELWLGELEEQGYAVDVCWGFEEAKQTIEWYYKGKLK